MELPEFTRTSMLLRLVCGLLLVGSAMAAGFMLRSPWIILPMGLAFSALFVIGKWKAWRLTLRSLGWKAFLTGLFSTVPIQMMIVALFYGPCLGFMMLTEGKPPIKPYGPFDTQYALVVLAVGAVLGIGAHLLELRAESGETQIDTPPPSEHN